MCCSAIIMTLRRPATPIYTVARTQKDHAYVVEQRHHQLLPGNTGDIVGAEKAPNPAELFAQPGVIASNDLLGRGYHLLA